MIFSLRFAIILAMKLRLRLPRVSGHEVAGAAKSEILASGPVPDLPRAASRVPRALAHRRLSRSVGQAIVPQDERDSELNQAIGQYVDETVTQVSDGLFRGLEHFIEGRIRYFLMTPRQRKRAALRAQHERELEGSQQRRIEG